MIIPANHGMIMPFLLYDRSRYLLGSMETSMPIEGQSFLAVVRQSIAALAPGQPSLNVAFSRFSLWRQRGQMVATYDEPPSHGVLAEIARYHARDFTPNISYWDDVADGRSRQAMPVINDISYAQGYVHLRGPDAFVLVDTRMWASNDVVSLWRRKTQTPQEVQADDNLAIRIREEERRSEELRQHQKQALREMEEILKEQDATRAKRKVRLD